MPNGWSGPVNEFGKRMILLLTVELLVRSRSFSVGKCTLLTEGVKRSGTFLIINVF